MKRGIQPRSKLLHRIKQNRHVFLLKPIFSTQDWKSFCHNRTLFYCYLHLTYKRNNIRFRCNLTCQPECLFLCSKNNHPIQIRLFNPYLPFGKGNSLLKINSNQKRIKYLALMTKKLCNTCALLYIAHPLIAYVPACVCSPQKISN